MSETTPVGLGLDAYVVFFVIMAVAIGLTYWLIPRVNRKRREAFVAEHAGMDLRVNVHKPAIVYRVLQEADGMVSAVCVWRGKTVERDGEAITAESKHFEPFDVNEFLGGVL